MAIAVVGARHDGWVPIDTCATPLVGRVDELRELAGLVGGERASGFVLLGGDAGAGKSRLVAELAADATERGWRVLIGHCLDFGDESAPYLPFSEALGRLSVDCPDEADAVVEAHPAIARLLPAQRMMGEADRIPAPTERAAVYTAMHGALEQLASESSLLLVIEDVHWADESTRHLLRYLFTRELSAPVAILTTYRSDDLNRRHPLRAALAEWVRLPAVQRLQLGPLSDDDARQLVSALHPKPLAEDDLAQITARAEGNPFFIEELVAAAEVSGGVLPADLADLLLVRLEQLSDDARLVVRAAAVAGRRVSHELLAYGTALDAAHLDEAVRAAVDANILIPGGSDGYAFRHALLAEAVYQDLLPGERVRLHATYAEALASHTVKGPAAELSLHARASHDLVTAVRASIEAGDEAMSVGGPDAATRHYELALDLLEDPGVAQAVEASADGAVSHVDLVLRASAAAQAAGHIARSVALADDALRKLPDTAPATDRVRLIHAVLTTALVMDIQFDVLALSNQAVGLMAEEPPNELHAQVLLTHARANADRARDEEAARWAGEALQMARDLRLPDVTTDATLLLAKLDERAGAPQRAEAAITQAITEAEVAGQDLARLRGLYNLAMLHFSQGRLELSASTFREAATLARQVGRQWAPFGAESVVFGAIVSILCGDWAGADALLDQTGQAPPEIAEAMIDAVALELAASRGELEALADAPRLRARWELDGIVALTSGAAMIELHGYAGDLDAARAVHDDAVETLAMLWQQPLFPARVRYAALLLGHLAAAAATTAGADRAALVSSGDELVAAAAEVASAGRHAGPEARAWTARVAAEHARLHWLAGIDPPDAATLIMRWEAAVEAFETYGHVYESGRSRARLAAARAAAGDAAGAKADADIAREIALRLGARSLLDELRHNAFGEGNGSAARGGAGGQGEQLTARERDVLALVATGRSNREIGQQLFISAKTVSVHISNLLAKLGASSRTEAVAIARRRGQLDESDAG
jgi:DNA-binding CsgD family transcriptional regulator